MLITISLLIIAYWIMGKDVKPLLERIKNIDWRGKFSDSMDKLRPWALKVCRVATRPLLQFYYVMEDEKNLTDFYFSHDRIQYDQISYHKKSKVKI